MIKMTGGVTCTVPVPADLYGLLLLLRVEPYSTRHWWNRLLWEPYLNFNMEPIAKVFSHLLWRSNKKDVAIEVSTYVLSPNVLQCE